MSNNKKVRIILIISFLIIQFTILTALIKNNKYHYIGSVISTTTFFVTYTVIEIKYNLYLGNYIRSLIILAILAHNFLGKYLQLYIKLSYFDFLLHIFGIYTFTLFFYSLITETINKSSSQSYNFIFLISLGTSLGACFEIIEYLLDIVLKPKIPFQFSLIDTNLDLIADLLGALLAAIHLTLF
ncbi:hypothetical protein Halha_1157 [Halobacteroides halobius DSM 5150]|uniref:Uncharacterized protein n=1 Tax=Halobacteroides halobius (strain ATCC 35273 / DSM 5150 / MD-1) TaxID=748449 RepID=L0K7V3_HALHC|nr:hypothetical protein [Halobacteroides halobius]AGB41106.1 hypothetical protein Halha_1157 [Halobacteroides halobius DSM 5150]